MARTNSKILTIISSPKRQFVDSFILALLIRHRQFSTWSRLTSSFPCNPPSNHTLAARNCFIEAITRY